jgi:glycosyltransferase involved in cell wall biosynthesis
MEIQNPLVSFIIPAYNRQEKLRKSVDSVLNQTYSNIELILIDDASQPSLKPYFDELKEKDCRVRYMINKENLGVSFSRNLGLSEAKGEYICFVDSDDYLALNRIEAQRDFFCDNDLMVCDYFLENNYEDQPKVISQDTGHDLLKRIVNRSLHLVTVGVIWRKEFLLKNSLKFDKRLRNSEDYLLQVTAILNRPKIHYLSRALVTVVRSHHESLTGNYKLNSSTKNKLVSHGRVFVLTLGKIPISDSAILLKKLVGFGGYFIFSSVKTSR